MNAIHTHIGVFAVIAGTANVAFASDDEPLILPSGLKATLQERLTDRLDGEPAHRFRFVAPAFKGVGDVFEQVWDDLEYLCTNYALPRLAEDQTTPGQVIISLADRPSEFGVADPSVFQVFEA